MNDEKLQISKKINSSPNNIQLQKEYQRLVDNELINDVERRFSEGIY